MNLNRPVALLVATLLVLGGLSACEKKKKEPEVTKIPPRTDFSREEFGIGRKHTKNTACNQEIDRLLDQIRVCLNTRGQDACTAMQDDNNTRIGKLKNQLRCAR
jgi:hypothetical protein